VSARAAVLTVSSSLARGEGEDVSGPALVRLCEEAGLEVQHEVVSDDRESIVAALKRLVDHDAVRFVFTTGGTGLTVDDVTPEATRDVIDRDAPGYAEAIRMDARDHTPLGLLTRGVSGVRGRTLIVNLPGNPKAIEQSWPILAPTLEHAAQLLERDS
jgi:molybdopterin adenylyltransferase